ncbi:MAG: hypothetical protein GX548_04930 [Lentisphaerae bacterium]|nr:hypothetical protein [Lentisphaerota bacterium]
MTYDEGPKGFITKWSWVSNDVLLGRAGITDDTGHEIIDVRLYVFHMKERALARLDLSALNLPDTAGIQIAGIGEDMKHLRLRSGDRSFAVKADLTAPPRLRANSRQTPGPNAQEIGQLPTGKDASHTPPLTSTPFAGDLARKTWTGFV